MAGFYGLFSPLLERQSALTYADFCLRVCLHCFTSTSLSGRVASRLETSCSSSELLGRCLTVAAERLKIQMISPTKLHMNSFSA